MTNRSLTANGIARRTALATIAAGVALPFQSVRADFVAPAKMVDDVAAQVRALVGSRQITLKVLLPQGAGGNLNPVIAQFETMTGVKIVTTEMPPDDISTELLLDTMTQSQRFDVALPTTFGLPDLVSAEAILPITDFAKKYEPTGFREDILFGVGDSFDGETYGFQTDGDAYMMFYNKAMLENPDEQARYADAYGTPLFKPRTWGELDRQMAFFQRPDKDQWGGLLFRSPGYVAWEWWVRFHAKGVWPFSKDMDPQIASDAGIEALEDMIRASENLHPKAKQLGLFENWERFGKGDIYCNIGWGGSQKYLNGASSNMRGNMIYGSTPGGMVDGKLLVTPYFNWGWDYVVTSNGASPEIAYLFALFASTPEMSTLAVRQVDGFLDPFRPEHYEDEGIKAAYSPEFLSVHQQSLENAIPDLYLKNQGGYFRALGEWLHRALEKEISPKEALERVEIRWRLITNSSDKAMQKQRWKQLRSKYPQHTQESLRDIV